MGLLLWKRTSSWAKFSTPPGAPRLPEKRSG